MVLGWLCLASRGWLLCQDPRQFVLQDSGCRFLHFGLHQYWTTRLCQTNSRQYFFRRLLEGFDREKLDTLAVLVVVAVLLVVVVVAVAVVAVVAVAVVVVLLVSVMVLIGLGFVP